VPLAAQFTSQCPLLLESDYLSLSSAFRLRPPLLYDTTVGAAHHISAPGEVLIQVLQTGTTYGDLLVTAEQNKLLTSIVVDMLGFLNLAGALSRRRGFGGWYIALRLTVVGWLSGVRFAPLTWRRAGTHSTLLIGLLRASWPVQVMSVGVCTLAVASNLLPVHTGLILLVASLGFFLASVYIHELGHMLILRRQNVRSDVLCRGLRLGLLHHRLGTSQEIQSAVMGPVAGTLLCLAGISCGQVLHQTLITASSCAVMLIHVGSLLPWYGDGASIRYALRKKGEA